MTKQAGGQLQDRDGGTCVIGAAMLGIGLGPIKENLPLLLHRFPQPITLVCPICDFVMPKHSDYKHLALLVHLNDLHMITRNAIASWIRRKLSRKQVPSEASPRSQPGATTLPARVPELAAACQDTGLAIDNQSRHALLTVNTPALRNASLLCP